MCVACQYQKTSMIEAEIENWSTSISYINIGNSGLYSAPSQISTTELFAKTVNA